MSSDQHVLTEDVPVLDQSRLLEEFGDSPEIMIELRDIFLEHLPPLLDHISQAYEAGDCATLAKNAHSLKGAASTYGAQRVAEMSRQLELQGKQGQLDGASDLITLLEQELGLLTEAISQLIGSG